MGLFLRFLREKGVNNMKEGTHVVCLSSMAKNSTTAVSHTSGQLKKEKVHFR